MSTTLAIDIAEHPLLDLSAFVTEFPAPIGDLASPDWLRERLKQESEATDDVRAAIRSLLRHGGFKPSGRSKPASEYLVRAAAEGTLESINVPVDACNAVSLRTGIPISVVDLDLLRPPCRVAVAKEGDRYVFNASGQEMDLEGLLCLFDSAGPSANPVKDSQRTKTHPQTTKTLTVLWSTNALPGLAAEATKGYREILERIGATTHLVR